MHVLLSRCFVCRVVSALSAATLMLLTGCATAAFDVNVTAVADGQTSKYDSTSFRLIAIANSADEKESVRRAMEIASAALKTKGLRDADDAVSPELFVAVSAGLVPGGSRFVSTVTPTYAMVPGQVRTVTQVVGMSSNGTPIYQQVVVQDPPTQVVTGYITERSEVMMMKKYFRLIAFKEDPRTHSLPQIPLWAVQSIFESEDAALKRLLPVLAAAASVFIGEETKGAVTIHIKESDPDVVAIRGHR